MAILSIAERQSAPTGVSDGVTGQTAPSTTTRILDGAPSIRVIERATCGWCLGQAQARSPDGKARLRQRLANTAHRCLLLFLADGLQATHGSLDGAVDGRNRSSAGPASGRPPGSCRNRKGIEHPVAGLCGRVENARRAAPRSSAWDSRGPRSESCPGRECRPRCCPPRARRRGGRRPESAR